MTEQVPSQNREMADVVVVGGGIIGLSIARALAIRGVKKIILLERTSLGAEASGAAAGMLAPQAEAECDDEFFKLACKSRDMYPDFATNLRDETGIDVELDTAGTLYVAFNEDDEKEIESRYEWQANTGLPVAKMDAIETRQLEPCISENVRAALRFPCDIQVENRLLVRALALANEKRGVRLLTGTKVESISIGQGRVVGVTTSSGFVASENVVVANGAWASLLRAADKSLPELSIEPVRGQMICLESQPQMVQHVIYSGRGYLVPRRGGRILAGSTTEQTGFDKHVTAAGIHSILSHALEISETVSRLRLIDCWAGLRPKAGDGLPVLGPSAEIEGLFYATGHYRNGILLAPLTAELIASAITEAAISPWFEPFGPNRFLLVGVH